MNNFKENLNENNQRLFDIKRKIENSLAPVSEKCFIDVFELPVDNINENIIYRCFTAKLIYNQSIGETFTVHCVDSLPEIGLPITNIDITYGNIYYIFSNEEGYGYVDEELSTAMGVPIGWHDVSTLIGALGESYSGVIKDIDEDPCDDSFRLLLTKEYYVYQDEYWCNIPFFYKKTPSKKINIKWDYNLENKFVFDMSQLGYENTLLVKVSDEVFTKKDLSFCNISIVNEPYDEYYTTKITYSHFNHDLSLPGTIVAIEGENGVVVVHDESQLNSALGAPSGYFTNGTYFIYKEDNYIKGLYISPEPQYRKIDEGFIPMDIFYETFMTYGETINEIRNIVSAELRSIENGSY